MQVFLVASTRLAPGYKSFLDRRQLTWRERRSAPGAQRLVELAGRICYLSFGSRQSPKTNAEYISHLISQGHESVLEHASFTLLVDDISRGLSHQLVRHRAGFSFSQLSQQYHDESNAIFAAPPGLDSIPHAFKSWRSAVKTARAAYRNLTKEISASRYGRSLSARERQRAIRTLARSVLPNATSTTLVVTANARAWRYLLTIRGDIAGDPEMREFCVAVFRILRDSAPALFEDFRVSSDEAGEKIERCINRG